VEPPVPYSELPQGDVLCVDMKSFYASVEAVERGLDPFKVSLAVVGNQEQAGSVILAATPLMKRKYDIKTGSRLFEVPKNDDIILVEPRMSLYLKKSLEIIELFSSYVPRKDIFVYSVDECWLDLNGSKQKFAGAWQLTSKLRNHIYNKYGLSCSTGIAPNMFLSKVAMDIEGKEKGIACWRYEDIPEKLWPLPVEKVWGIGSRTAEKFNRWQIYTMEDVARKGADFFRRRLGVVGEEIYYQAWGVDESLPRGYYDDERKSIGRGATLYRDYVSLKDIKTVIFNLSEDIGYRARCLGLAGKTISLSLKYSRHYNRSGFQAQRTLPVATNLEHEILQVARELLQEKHHSGAPVRRISVSLTSLVLEEKIQLNLFSNKERLIRLAKTRDKIRDKFGAGKLDYGLSRAEGSIRGRLNSNIGGHKE